MPAQPTSQLGRRRLAPVGFHLGPPARDLDALSTRAVDLALGPSLGLVRDCVEVPGAEGAPRLHTFVARGPLRIPGLSFCEHPQGTGVGIDRQRARAAAVAEAIESYCSLVPADPVVIRRARFTDVDGFAIPPGSFAWLTPRQYSRLPGVEPLTDDTVIDWRWAYSLTRDSPVLLPAALVQTHDVGRPAQRYFPERLSTGLACHVSLTNAVLNGLCEVLERDALAVTWHNRLPVRQLDVEGTPVAAFVSTALAGCGLELALYQLPTDSPFPVVLAVAWSSRVVPGAVVGAACRPAVEEAAIKAVSEACQVLSGFRPDEPPRRPTRVRHLDDHADLYATEEGGALLRRHLTVGHEPAALGSVRTARVGSPEGDLASAVDRLSEMDLEVVVAELTTCDAVDAGFRVVRVIVPGMLDVCADARFPQLGAARLYEQPVSLGLRERPLPEHRLNRLPVPLA